MKNFDKSNPQHLKKLYNLTKLYHLFSIYSKKDEFWTNIKNYNNYQISNYGRIKSLNYSSSNLSKIMKLTRRECHLYIQLQRKEFSIHKLVLELGFEIPNPENKDTIDHININGFDNRLINLRYATRLEQVNNRTINKNKEKMSGARAVNMLDMNTLEIKKTFISAVEAAEYIRDNTDYKKALKSVINFACHNKNANRYKYKWQFVEKEEFENEIWKIINKEKMKIFYPDFNDELLDKIELYEISSYGRYRQKLKKNKILNGSLDSHGYMRMRIHKKTFKIHRIVAIIFIPNINPKILLCVDHKDNNKSNNHISNLQLTTYSQNTQNSVNTGSLQVNKKKIIAIKKNGETEEFDSIINASKKLNISYSGISKVCLGKQHTTGGIKFKFI